MPSEEFWQDKTVAITGGSGSLGRALTRRLLREKVRAIRLIARGEYALHQAGEEFPDPRVRVFIGDVRDVDRMRMAFYGADVVVNGAALKRIEMSATDPLEFIRTNVHGTEAVIQAALDCGVGRLLGVSTDKACEPISIYGSTKQLAEGLLVAANVYSGPRRTRFAACRYGNVVGSKGSFVPLLIRQRASGHVTLTARRMSRFWMRMSEAVDLVLSSVEEMCGGEIFVSKIPSVWIDDVIQAVAPGCTVDLIGLRGVEKMHESLVGFSESRSCENAGSHYIIRPGTVWDQPSFSYTSDGNEFFLSVEEIRGQFEAALVEAQ